MLIPVSNPRESRHRAHCPPTPRPRRPACSRQGFTRVGLRRHVLDTASLNRHSRARPDCRRDVRRPGSSPPGDDGRTRPVVFHRSCGKPCGRTCRTGADDPFNADRFSDLHHRGAYQQAHRVTTYGVSVRSRGPRAYVMPPRGRPGGNEICGLNDLTPSKFGVSSTGR